MPQWEKGQSGNPAGRPPGSKNAQTDLREALEAHGKAILDQLVEKAKAGDQTTARFLLKRLLPGARSAPLQVPMQLQGTTVNQAEQVKNALAEGALTLEEAQGLLAAIHTVELTREAAELSKKVGELEERLNLVGHVQEALCSARESRANFRTRLSAIEAAIERDRDDSDFPPFLGHLNAELEEMPPELADAVTKELCAVDLEEEALAVSRQQSGDASQSPEPRMVVCLRQIAKVAPEVAKKMGEVWEIEWEEPSANPMPNASPPPEPCRAGGLAVGNAEGSQTQH